MSKVIIGTGSDLPEWALTNDALEALGVGYDRSRSGKTLEQWSLERVGVQVRHRVRPGEGPSDMGTRAAQRALDDAGLQASDVGLMVMATFSSDYRTPPSAALVQANLGCRCKFIQIDAACSGFVDATITAAGLMDALDVENALVIGSDANSLYCAPDDFMAHCIFGDGAGAVVLRNMPGSPYGLKAYSGGGDGSRGKYVWLPGGGSKEPMSEKVLAEKRQYIQWAHKEVGVFAAEKMAESALAVAERAGWGLDDVTWFIPHQAGRNVILAVSRLLEQPEDRFFINIDHTGNTSAASIPIALDEINRAGKLKDGDRLIMPAAGVGMAWGALAVVWSAKRSG